MTTRRQPFSSCGKDKQASDSNEPEGNERLDMTVAYSI